MDLNNLLKNPMKFVKDINMLKETINILDNENLLIETSMESSRLRLLNDIMPTIKITHEKYADALSVMLGLTGTNKIKKELENMTGKFIYLLTKHMWCLYLTDKISYDKIKEFYLNLFGIDIEKNSNSILGKYSIKDYLNREDPINSKYDPRDPRDPRYDPRYDPRDPRYDPRYDPRDARYDPRYDPRDPRYDPRYDPRDPRYDPRYDPRDPRYDPRDPRYDPRDPRDDPRTYGSKSASSSLKVNTTNILLDFDPNRSSLSLQKMISDMRIRKKSNKLYMINNENHPIDDSKMNEWISLQCNSEAKDLANVFKANTKYVSWKDFYESSKKVFDRLYDIVKDKTYCVFTKEALGNVSFEDKSNYWMLCLLLDHYIKTGKTNLPKELLLCGPEHFESKCPESNYDYYISLDDCIYSGGQMFTDAIITKTIDKTKIIVVSPYISEFAYEKYISGKGTEYNDLIFETKMNFWWKNKNISVGGKNYDLNKPAERDYIFDLLKKYFPSPRRDKVTGDIRKWGTNNFMYYFDHKIADYASSFPSVYHLGIITPDGTIEKTSVNTYDDSRVPSAACLKPTYIPFVKNCLNPTPTISDIDEKAKTNPEKLCIEPWYKKKYTTTYDKKVLVIDFDETITNITIKDNEALTKPLDEIFTKKSDVKKLLEMAWNKMVPVYIVSRRQRDILIQIINRFYQDQNITFHRIYENNILGRPNSFAYPSDIIDAKQREIFWAEMKVKYLDFIVSYENVTPADIIFFDDSQLNINKSIAGGYKYSYKVDKRNATHVLEEFKKYISSLSNFTSKYITHAQSDEKLENSNFNTKYLKYKQKYIALKKLAQKKAEQNL